MTNKKRPSLQPRKIPQQSRAEQTVAAILEAAARILETKGSEGLNTNSVAKRAGVSIGSLYQYFHGKDALIVALCQRELALFVVEAEAAFSEPTGRKALKRLIAAGVNQQLRRPALAHQLDFETSRPAIAGELAPLVAAIHQLIHHILCHKDFAPQPSIETATGDLIAILRALVDAAGERGEVDRRGLERRVSRALFGYLGIDDHQPTR